MRNILIICCRIQILLCLELFFSIGSSAFASTTNESTPCKHCHGVEMELQNQNSCGRCHSSNSSKVDSDAVKRVDMQAPKAAVNNKLGMKYSQYYLKSRLGNAPNDMLKIPAGMFVMGSNSRLPDEGPEHEILLPEYFIDKYEVTNLQYKQFIDATNRKSPDTFRNRTYVEGKVDHPVVYVSWEDANAYCRWADKRLPTEAEWEKAARGADARQFPWGNEFSVSYANTPARWRELNVFGDTTPVGSFESGISPFGLYDMSGNVWEWTESWYLPHPGNKTQSENYGKRYKILKGGSWWDCSFYKCGLSAPTFNRSFFAPNVKNDSFGFRCAKDSN